LEGKDVAGMLRTLEPAVDEIVITENSSSRSMSADDVGEIAVDIFGPERVTIEPRLDNALETAVNLSEENADDVLSGAGVIVTGSVVTAGEARTLLTGQRGPRGQQ
jgi:dihydrofolate synthase/folylpolyglutamate synthase